MLTPVTHTLLKATSCPSAGGHFPKLITQFFQALDYTLVAINGGDTKGPTFFKA